MSPSSLQLGPIHCGVRGHPRVSNSILFPVACLLPNVYLDHNFDTTALHDSMILL